MNAVTLTPRHLVMLGLLVTAACGGRGHGTGTAPAPNTPEATLDQFLAAVNASDLERMAMLWGDEHGPQALTQTMSNEQRTQRLTIMQRLLRSDTHQVTQTDTSDPSKRVLTVVMTQGTRRFTVPFTFVQPRDGGWLINQIGLDAAMPQVTPGAQQQPQQRP